MSGAPDLAYSAAGLDPDTVWAAIKQQESGGNGNAVGPQTPYGQAQGSTQMLMPTAEAMARKLGVAWRPDLMRGDTPLALSYQDRLGRAYFDEGLAANNGDPAAAAAYYYGGPDPKLHGPKTAKYVQDVMTRATGQTETGSDAGDTLPSADEVMKAYGFTPDGTPAPQRSYGQGSSYSGKTATDAQNAFAAKFGQTSGEVGSASNPSYDTPDSTGTDDIYHVDLQGNLHAPKQANAGMPSPDDVAKAYGWQTAPPPAPVQPARNSLTGNIAGFMANVNRGLGVGDEMAAGFRTAGDLITGKTSFSDLPTDFKTNMAHQRQLEDSFTAAHPHIAALGRGTGNALTMAAPLGPGAEAFQIPVQIAGRNVPMVAANALRGATVAGLTGAGYAAVDRGTLAQRAQAAANAANPVTNPVGFTLGAGAGALATTGAPKPAPAPTLEQLEAEKGALYDGVSQSGARYTPEAFDGLAGDMTKAVAGATPGARFNPQLYPKTAAMLEHIQGLTADGYSPTPTELDQLRQYIGNTVAGSSDAGERRMGVLMKGAIDDFMANASPDQITGVADPGSVAADLARARDLNTRIVKLQRLDGLDEAAQDRAAVSGSGSNGQNTLRQNVLRFRNKTGNLTPDEEDAANAVIRGSKAQNALRMFGKTSPGNGGLMANAHLIAAEVSHGASVPIGVAGSVSKAISDWMATKNTQALRDLIARGGDAAATEISRQIAAPQYAELRAQLANDLAAAAGAQSVGANQNYQAAASQQ